MKQCSRCKRELDDNQFVCKRGLITVTCANCREKLMKRNSEKKIEATKKWREKNKEYISFLNNFYCQTIDLDKPTRKILLQKLKIENNFENQVLGKPSKHRKPHYLKNGILGKECSVKFCGWKSLSDFNVSSTHWDKLRVTCKQCLKEERKKYRNRINIWYKARLATNSEFKLRQNLQKRLHSAVKYQKCIKQDKTLKYLGCTISDFKKYIELQFTEGMSWKKYGFYNDSNGKKQIGFHLDHIIPCIAFDLTKEENVYLCFYWKNYQPMWGIENIIKNGTYNEKDKLDYINSVRDEVFRNCKLIQPEIFLKTNKNDCKEVKETFKVKETEDNIKAKEILHEFKIEQAMEYMQIMFYQFEKNKTNPSSSKDEAYMKNHLSRKYGSFNSLSKKVHKLSLKGEVLNTYNSITEAANANNTFHSSISNCCRGIKQNSGGFKWQYVL